jgi:hypothetical protein
MAADDIDFTCDEALARHDDEILRSEFHMAITRQVELEGLLEEGGLRLHALHADFEGSTWTPEHPRELVVLARHISRSLP